MNALLVNTGEPACGVNNYGLNLYEILKPSTRIDWQHYNSAEAVPVSLLRFFDAVVFNWSPLIGGWIKHAPFVNLGKGAKQFYVFHDGPVKEGWDGIFFSDPTMKDHENWHSLGRPIPNLVMSAPAEHDKMRPVVGVHGFLGAWANCVVEKVVGEFEIATVRLQLPYSKFCDPNGDQARSMADRCRSIIRDSGSPMVKLEISHDFLPPDKLVQWLSQNDINCYFRPVEMNWTGVSSAPDLALAARRPIAVNRCNAFRHLHHTKPSITVEDSSITEIIINGLEPMIPLYQAWSPEVIRKQVEDVIYKVSGKA